VQDQLSFAENRRTWSPSTKEHFEMIDKRQQDIPNVIEWLLGDARRTSAFDVSAMISLKNESTSRSKKRLN
jgi:hypothetical protein